MPNGDPIDYHVHKILETLGLDREAYPDKETISNLEDILHHFLHTDPIYYYVHKILEAAGLDLDAYLDDRIISNLEHILIHLLLTEGSRR